MKSAVFVGLVGLGLMGCAPTADVNAKEPSEPVVISNAPVQEMGGEAGKLKLSESVQVGLAAPDFALKDEKGKEWKLSDYKGKLVLLDFWGFWCPTCVDELPELRQYNDELMGTDFVMIGMNTDSDIEVSELKTKLTEHKVNWRQGIVPDGDSLMKDYDVNTFPVKVLIDKTGKIVYIDHFIDKSVILKHI